MTTLKANQTTKLNPVLLAAGVGSLSLIAGGLILLVLSFTSNPTPVEVHYDSMPDDATHNALTGAQVEFNAVSDFVDAALDYAAAGDVAAAIDSLEIAIAAARGTDAAAPHYYLGVIHAQFNEFDPALENLNAAIEADPQFAAAYAALGSVLLSQGRPVDAIEPFSTALSFEPEDALTLTNRGQAYLRAGVDDRALADFNAAIELDAEAIGAYFNRGTYYVMNSQPELAIADFSTILVLDPVQPMAHFNRATAYVELGDIDAAIADLELFVAFNPGAELVEQAEALIAELEAES